jgi:hypothetical protein
MMRATNDPGSPYYAAFVTPGNGISVQWRASQGGTSSNIVVAGTVPAYLMVARSTSGSTTSYTAYTSPNGSTWTAIAGSTVTLNLPTPLLAGFAITSHNQGTGSAVTLDTVSVGGAAPPPAGCPTSWSCADIGGATPSGSQSLSSGTWTVMGGGGDIWGTSDQFHYVTQTLAADGGVSARVASQTNSDPWAKAGVMLRSTTAAGSAYYSAFVTPGNGVVVQSRSATGATAVQEVQLTGTVPIYLKVARSGTTFTAYTSPDGVTWTAIAGSSISLPGISGSVLAGLAVTSHNVTTLSTVTFDHVTIG